MFKKLDAPLSHPPPPLRVYPNDWLPFAEAVEINKIQGGNV